MNFKSTLFLLSSVLVFIACKKEKAAEEVVTTEEPSAFVCDSTNSFANDVLPILNSYNCGASGCHSTASAQSGIRLTNYSQVSVVATNTLLGAIKHSSGFNPMPSAGVSLTATEINKIECWINNGKLNN